MLITLNSSPQAAAEAPPIEIVLRRGQALQLLVLVVTILLLTSATSYLLGRNSAEVVTPTPPPANPPAPTPASAAPEEPPPVLLDGATYLQIAAVDPGVGEVFVEVLKRKYFSAIAAPGPDAGTVRVLVGPVRDEESYQTLREDLRRAGFLSFPRKWRAQAAAPA